ncbi:MAG: undecaprenyldiphospho-muramoylpentapeptide beta-N-acetylglucosaminyltransferase [Bacteroidaceae bacterium]|nr:undecaprenyldiphospho-muramoylpentapeptide beta-N-acetylglucosaminyltransferase [Bacteroidaceae bacterium]
MEQLKVIISGGGTGGHIFPAVSIANAIKGIDPEADILFVGAEGRMEMQRVPDAGYPIIGLPIEGFDRKNPFRNIRVLWKILKCQLKARSIIRDFKPQVVVGVGGYASGPTLKTAGQMGIPTLIQEQNSYAGVTNKLLAKSASKICVAYEGMERFFPADKIILTGNPVRQQLLNTTITHEQAVMQFGLNPTLPTILIIGGSLGARTINESVLAALDDIRQSGIQIIWQTGKFYSQHIAEELAKHSKIANLYVSDFISNMDVAYAAADLVISRAGASSISELCMLGKPCILVPSPNVAEDHQTKNALALVHRDAALMVKDADAPHQLIKLAMEVVRDTQQLTSLSSHIKKMALPDSANIIAKEVIRLATEHANSKR